MARERYLIDDTEDTIHRDEIVPKTGKEKRENWWFYHKTHLIVAVIAVALVSYFAYSIITREKPDYNVTIMTEYTMPAELVQDLEDQLQRYAADLNGDGKTVVSLQHLQFSTSSTSEYDTGMLQASFVKFAADSSSADSVLFIYDDASYKYLDNNDMSGFFAPVGEMTDDYVLFEDIPGFTTMELNNYAETGASKENVMRILGSLKVSIRAQSGTAFDDGEKRVYREENIALLDRLINNTPVQSGAQNTEE